jgi:ABC-type Zn uptake system ZnuABC Zn-binding protein ZnuA
LKRAKASFILLMFATVVGAGCSNVSVASSPLAVTSIHELSEIDLLPGEMLRVVVTTSILGDVVANVAGENVDLQVLLPTGADPHSYQPTPQDLTTIADAHVLFINGLGLEIFLQDALANAGGQAIVISLSEGVPARTIASHDLEPHDAHDENFSDVDAHVWLDPANGEWRALSGFGQ